MPEVVRGSSLALDRTSFSQPIAHSESQPSAISPSSPVERPRVTFDQNRDDTSTSLPTIQTTQPPRRTVSIRRHSSHNHRRTRDLNDEERAAYYDSRAATQAEYRRRGSTLQDYYQHHPELLPQLPFTLRHGFKRWKLAGYIFLMVFDACVVPILLYYSMTYGGNVQGYITFAVITAIWGGPTYVEFAVRSIRLIKKKHFFKPLGANQRWAFDITNWILVLAIATVTSLLIVGAAPHIVFLRVLSMPGPAILYTIAGPIFLMNLYSACGWKAPFRISSTAKGEKVHPGIFYIAEDIVAVNSGGGRPFSGGSWFWSIPGLVVAVACTVVICIHPVPKAVAYGIGWAVPFIWAGIWAAITVPWVKSVMNYERKSWEEDATILEEAKKEPSTSSTLGGVADEDSNTLRASTMRERGESASPPSDGMGTIA
ncbi:hypothetical protein LOCC1_G008764 [Lachnellula occidentalis]|uniref:Uncharacterized protein n=1 Tax=Lachnellula occidentalis TaxID=215460 RepID=A0A8H8RCS0_9HELO|nr:hypothetical protein LOCC1_G008764 [Lachnellula occidentalis]